MYQTKYKQALIDAGLTEIDLLPKTVEILNEVKSLESEISHLDINEEDENSLEQLDTILESKDTLLCKKIKNNTFYKSNAEKLQAGRIAKKSVANQSTHTFKQVKATGGTIAPQKETIETKKDSGLGVVLGVVASFAGLIAVGKWQKWF
jgi:hypothetical protein